VTRKAGCTKALLLGYLDQFANLVGLQRERELLNGQLDSRFFASTLLLHELAGRPTPSRRILDWISCPTVPEEKNLPSGVLQA
jgi:hypothetical protein